MGRIFYIGAYSGDEKRLERKNIRINLAGSKKMEYVYSCLKKQNENVILVAIAPSKNSGICKQEIIQTEDGGKHVYIGSIVLRLFGKNIVRGDMTRYYLKKYICENVTHEDTVVVYHSLIYKNLFNAMKKKIGFRLVIQVEELYCLSSGQHYAPKKLMKEERMIVNADGYLFVNDVFPKKYAKGKPFAVSYGDYSIYLKPSDHIREKEYTNLVYTGILSEDRGIYVILDAMRLVDDSFRLKILGFGTNEELKRVYEIADDINRIAGWDKICIDGTRYGNDYNEYMKSCDVGISMLRMDDEFSDNAFPSKIMAYLGLGIKVISTANKCIVQSGVSDLLIYCKWTAESLAQAIVKSKNEKYQDYSQRLLELQKKYEEDLKNVLQS